MVLCDVYCYLAFLVLKKGKQWTKHEQTAEHEHHSRLQMTLRSHRLTGFLNQPDSYPEAQCVSMPAHLHGYVNALVMTEKAQLTILERCEALWTRYINVITTCDHVTVQTIQTPWGRGMRWTRYDAVKLRSVSCKLVPDGQVKTQPVKINCSSLRTGSNSLQNHSQQSDPCFWL